jgi:hypothetical protein
MGTDSKRKRDTADQVITMTVPVSFEVSGPGWIDADNPEFTVIFEVKRDERGPKWADGRTVTMTLIQKLSEDLDIRIATKCRDIENGWTHIKFENGELIDGEELTFNRTAGAGYFVEAQCDGQTSRTRICRVVTGEPAHIAINLECSVLPADGLSTTVATATVTDIAGNPVVDRTSVSWDADGMLEFEVLDPEGSGMGGSTVAGRSRLHICSTQWPGNYRVLARVGRIRASVDIVLESTRR